MLRDWLYRVCFPNEGFHPDAFHRAIAERLAQCTPSRLLDLGCGANTALEPYRTANREVWGCDFQRHPSLAHPDWFRLLHPNGGIPFDDETFDLVSADWVIEHVGRPRVFLTEVARVLKPGGFFIGHSISGGHYLTWVRRLFDLTRHDLVAELIHRVYGREHHDTFPTYYRLNTPGQLSAAAASAGMRVVELTFFADQHYFSFFKPLQCLAIVADRVLDWLAEGLGRIYFVVVMQK